MKRIAKYIFVAAAAVLSASCGRNELDPYKPAPVPSGDQVYFKRASQGLNLYGCEKESAEYKIALYRVVDGDALTVNVAYDLDANKEAFTLPSTVSFEKGSKETFLTIAIKVASFAEGSTSKLKISIADEDQASAYGMSEIQAVFTNEKAAEWTAWDKGVVVEVPWGESEKKTLYTTPFRGNILKCKIPECFGYETIKGGDPYDVQDYIFYWDTETNNCYVTPQYMGYINEDGEKTYISDAAGFYSLYKEWYTMDDFMSEEYVEWCIPWLEDNGFNVPYYDGNGRFYLADWYYYVDSSLKPTGYGLQFGGAQDHFTGGSYVRTTDYSALDYKVCAKGTVESEAFGGVFDAQFSKAEDPNSSEEEPSTVYYINNYFSEGHGLSFIVANTVPEEDGEEVEFYIKDGDCTQFHGETIFGKEIGANIVEAKSSISGDPTVYPCEITLVVKLGLYDVSQDEDGKTVHTLSCEFGKFTEKITIEAADGWYSADDLQGLKKEYYEDNYDVLAHDFFEDEYFSYSMSIEDAGEVEGVSLLSFKNFFPYEASDVPGNSFLVEWYEGFLYVAMADVDGGINYKDENHKLQAIPFSSDSEEYYEDSYLLGGYYYNEATEYECVPFVNYPYNDDAVDGVVANVPDLGVFGAFDHISMEFATPEPATSSISCAAVPAKWEVRTVSEVKAIKAASDRVHKAFNLPTVGTKNFVEVPVRKAIAKSHGLKLNTSKMEKVGKKNITAVKF